MQQRKGGGLLWGEDLPNEAWGRPPWMTSPTDAFEWLQSQLRSIICVSTSVGLKGGSLGGGVGTPPELWHTSRSSQRETEMVKLVFVFIWLRVEEGSWIQLFSGWGEGGGVT